MHMAIPLSHDAAYFYCFSAAVYYSMTSVIVPKVSLITEIVDKALRHGYVQACCDAPSILIYISKNPAYPGNTKSLNFVMYGRGPLSKHAGDYIQKEIGTSTLSLLRSTETMLLPLEASFQEDWDYHRFLPVYRRARLNDITTKAQLVPRKTHAFSETAAAAKSVQTPRRAAERTLTFRSKLEIDGNSVLRSIQLHHFAFQASQDLVGCKVLLPRKPAK